MRNMSGSRVHAKTFSRKNTPASSSGVPRAGSAADPGLRGFRASIQRLDQAWLILPRGCRTCIQSRCAQRPSQFRRGDANGGLPAKEPSI